MFHVKHKPLPNPEPMAVRLDALARWLAASAVPLGLTGYRDASSIWAQAMEPALLLPRMFCASIVGPWLEIGAGSGALGLTLAILSPAAHLTLADRRERVVAHLDLAIRRLAATNAEAHLARMGSASPPHRWVGVCLRALAEPTASLDIAQRHAQRWICTWHSPSIAAYDDAPRGFDVVARDQTTRGDLCATLYRRR